MNMLLRQRRLMLSAMLLGSVALLAWTASDVAAREHDRDHGHAEDAHDHDTHHGDMTMHAEHEEEMDEAWDDEGDDHDERLEHLEELEEHAREVFDDGVEEFVRAEMAEVARRLELRHERAMRPGAPLEQRFEFYEWLIGTAHEVRELLELRAHEPELFDVRVKIMRNEATAEILGERYEQTQEPEQRERIRTELRQVLERGFEMGQELREREIEAIEREMEKIRGLLDERETHRELIIDRRMRQILDDVDPFEW